MNIENKMKEAEEAFPVEYFMWSEDRDPESTPYSYANKTREKFLTYLRESLEGCAQSK